MYGKYASPGNAKVVRGFFSYNGYFQRSADLKAFPEDSLSFAPQLRILEMRLEQVETLPAEFLANSSQLEKVVLEAPSATELARWFLESGKANGGLEIAIPNQSITSKFPGRCSWLKILGSQDRWY